MPLTVSRWPQFPDPRDPTFGSRGCSPQTAAPWKWWVVTTGATGSYDPFNTGIMLPNTLDAEEIIRWEVDDFPAVGWTTKLQASLWYETDPPSRNYTAFYALEIRDAGLLRWFDNKLLLYPDNVLDVGPMQCNLGAIDRALMPNTVQVVPRAWNLGPP